MEHSEIADHPRQENLKNEGDNSNESDGRTIQTKENEIVSL